MMKPSMLRLLGAGSMAFQACANFEIQARASVSARLGAEAFSSVVDMGGILEEKTV
jgi:hypothetical protein